MSTGTVASNVSVARAATEEDVVGEAPAEEDRAMERLSAAVEEVSTGGEVMQAAGRVLVETMQIRSMEEARQQVLGGRGSKRIATGLG